MTAEQNERECLNVIAATIRADGRCEMPVEMLKSLLRLAFLNGQIASDEAFPDRIDKVFDKVLRDIKSRGAGTTP